MKTKNLFLKKWDEYKENDITEYQAMEERDYLIQFLKLAKYFNVKTVLDAGCGSAYITEILVKHGFKVTAFDLNTKQALERKEKSKLLCDVEIIEGNIEALPFENKEFDAVMCLGVLHHTHTTKTLPELKRVAGKMIYIGVYGNRNALFRFGEVMLRHTLRIIPYSVNRAILKLAGMGNKDVARILEHIYIEIADRYSEWDLTKMLGADYFCVTNRVRYWVNCTAIKKEVLEAK